MPLELRRLAPEGERNGLEVERETVKVERQAPRVVRLPEKTPHPSPLPQGEREPEACGDIGKLTRMGAWGFFVFPYPGLKPVENPG